jgi:hypothetical protein
MGFTLEKEKDGMLPFLDVEVKRVEDKLTKQQTQNIEMPRTLDDTYTIHSITIGQSR